MDRGAGGMVLPLLQFRLDQLRGDLPGLLSDASVEKLLAQHRRLDPVAGDIYDVLWGHLLRENV